jgi:hypothetical protein
MVWMGVVVPALKVVKEIVLRDPGATAAVVTSVTASSMGFLPRVGPLRALVLAARSKVCGASPLSQRAMDVQSLLSNMATLEKGQYVVVTGAKGIGKSCVVETATRYTCGVVRIDIPAGARHETIVQRSLMEVTNIRLPFLNIYPSAKRVLFWYGLFSRAPPIVILRVAERMDLDKYAQVPSAARELAHLGLRVLIDGSTNSLPIETLNTKREVVLDLEPMSKEEISCIPEYSKLLEELENQGLFDVVWAVIGGVPADFQKLNQKWKQDGHTDIEIVVYQYVRDLLAQAISRRTRMLAEFPGMNDILDLFKTEFEIRETIIEEKTIKRSSPDKVLRTVLRKGNVVLIPADASMAFVLRHQLRQTPLLDELKEMASKSNS